MSMVDWLIHDYKMDKRLTTTVQVLNKYFIVLSLNISNFETFMLACEFIFVTEWEFRDLLCAGKCTVLPLIS